MVSLSDQSTEGPAGPLATPGPPPAWPLWLFRIVVTIEAVLAFDQAVFAGQFISGDYGALNSHQTGATVTGVLLIVETLAAVALWRFGRGPEWPMWATFGLLLLTGVEVGLGFQRVLVVHVPVGVAIIALDLLMLVWAWRYRPGQPAPAAAGRAGDGEAGDGEADGEEAR